MYSDCCGAYSEYADDIDICPDCKEHCEFINDEEEDYIKRGAEMSL